MDITATTGDGMTENIEQMKALYEAMSKAQGEMSAAKKDRTNPHMKYAYATLASVIDAVREPFANNGLSHMSFVRSAPIDGAGWDVSVTVRIAHAGGAHIESEMSAPLGDSKGLTHIQAAGVLITYMRRYLMMALCGVAPDDDDDGASAPPVQKPAAPRPTPPGADAFRLKALAEISAAKSPKELDDASLALSKGVVENFPDASHPARAELRAAIQAKRKELTPPVDASVTDDIPLMGSGVKAPATEA
jgi:hypothetical protein